MKREAVVVDIDGVLCDNVGRMSAYIKENNPPFGAFSNEWLPFYDEIINDRPKPEWVRMVALLNPHVAVVLLTCRPTLIRKITQEWLSKHFVPYDELIMWEPERHGYYEHKEVAIEALARRYTVRLVIEDSEKHVKMFRGMGLPVVHVAGGFSDSEHDPYP